MAVPMRAGRVQYTVRSTQHERQVTGRGMVWCKLVWAPICRTTSISSSSSRAQREVQGHGWKQAPAMLRPGMSPPWRTCFALVRLMPVALPLLALRGAAGRWWRREKRVVVQREGLATGLTCVPAWAVLILPWVFPLALPAKPSPHGRLPPAGLPLFMCILCKRLRGPRTHMGSGLHKGCNVCSRHMRRSCGREWDWVQEQFPRVPKMLRVGSGGR
mmetsp:Transcript_17086/g.47334  ORF Transcript_17086/g.47334 Transcript_17086/m.47334 type:complete len:216 (-) Transcript_17086:577-1224(-)